VYSCPAAVAREWCRLSVTFEYTGDDLGDN
jgi:hypothetical protein